MSQVFQGYKAVRAYNGEVFNMPGLDLALGEQLLLSDTHDVQVTAIDSELVIAFAQGGDARICWGTTPVASIGAGSVPLADGGILAIIKQRGDKISVINADGSSGGVVDLFPALAVYQ